MISLDRQKDVFLQVALSHLNRPYIWGGDDPVEGFDCSGLVIECLKSIGRVEESFDTTANNLFAEYRRLRIEYPRSGALLFSISPDGRATHVTICLDEYFEIGASGGGSRTQTSEAAASHNAYVKIRPIRLSPRKKLIYLF